MTILGYNVYVVNSPDLIKLVLSSPHNVMQYPSVGFKLYLSPHMLTQERMLEMHGFVRRATVATYTGDKLHRNLSLINQIASQAVRSWLHRKRVNAFDELNKVTNMHSKFYILPHLDTFFFAPTSTSFGYEAHH